MSMGIMEVLIIGVLCVVMIGLPVGIALIIVLVNRSQRRAVADANLVPCPDCGRGVSRRAASCPHCGCPLPQNGSTNANDSRSENP